MLKAEELSIGDWVKVLNYYWDESPYVGQVDGIVKRRGTYYLQFSDAFSAEIDRCKPIPITPEILVRNGFKEEDDVRYLWNENLERVIWFCDGTTAIISIRANRVFKGHCFNVHELQHALRLCGITKEIELKELPDSEAINRINLPKTIKS